MPHYEVKCISIIEETFEVYADDEKEAINIVNEVLEDPDKTLMEQNVINKSNYRVKEID
jgi:predicted small metal-binding protein